MYKFTFLPRFISQNHVFCLQSANQALRTSIRMRHIVPRLEEESSEPILNSHVKKGITFKNVSHVTPSSIKTFLFDKMKLKFVQTDDECEAGIELLRNIASNYDYWIIRNDQTQLLYYRIQMLLQRIAFLKTVGLTPSQKLRQIQKSPPVLLFSFTDSTYHAKMVYLRGMIRKSATDFNHLFYPVTQKTTIYKAGIEQRVANIEKELNIKRPAVLRELLNMPCFFMDPDQLKDINHLFVHKYSMPVKYDVDQYSLNVFPPICNLAKINLDSGKYFGNKANNNIIASLPTYKINDILDYSYGIDNGKGNPECLSKFLIDAELEEDKDRTGGQPLKGRRGFNVAPRQY